MPCLPETAVFLKSKQGDLAQNIYSLTANFKVWWCSSLWLIRNVRLTLTRAIGILALLSAVFIARSCDAAVPAGRRGIVSGQTRRLPLLQYDSLFDQAT